MLQSQRASDVCFSGLLQCSQLFAAAGLLNLNNFYLFYDVAGDENKTNISHRC